MKHQPRKRFGQNFLKDPLVVDRLLNSLRLTASDIVIEVGPGLGALTQPLLEQLDALTVIEIDRDLVAKLQARGLPGLTVLAGDVLNTDFTQLSVEPLRIVGNLPYNIGTPLLLRLLEAHSHLRDVHVMLQKEVVDRLHATVGSRAYGRLGVLMQSTFDIQPLFTVPPEAFDPPPKVQSAIVRLKPLATAPTAAARKALEFATRVAFANKRKTLRNNLREHLTAADLEALEINPQARAETLDADAFQRLATALAKLP
ncbi:MAG: 16S rRNA (adenine(1518)-N(6)/adenine(1519)-N(6))-dimethyltransferase RsmA [Granulosicoccus sp.]